MKRLVSAIIFFLGLILMAATPAVAAGVEYPRSLERVTPTVGSTTLTFVEIRTVASTISEDAQIQQFSPGAAGWRRETGRVSLTL